MPQRDAPACIGASAVRRAGSTDFSRLGGLVDADQVASVGVPSHDGAGADTPAPSAARVYRVEPESEPLTAAEYLRAQADFTQSWISTDAARALNPADIAVSKDLADASLEVLAEMDALERARDEAFALLGEAYTGEYPSNRWRKRVEDLGAWPVKQ